MRIRRRTAAALCALFVLIALGGAAWRLLQPDRLRGIVLAEGRKMLAPGFDFELDAVDYDLWEGLFRAEGLRLVRTGGEREVLASFASAEVSTRLWQLFANFALTDVRVSGLEVVLERTADGRFPLEGAFRAAAPGDAPSAPAHRPRIRVDSGTVRFRDGAVLAPGGDLVLRIEGADWQESRGGGPSALEGRFRELGSGTAGAGALGPVTVRGEFPLSTRGIRLQVERFRWDDDLVARLSPEVRGNLAGIRLEGEFGEGPESPALEVEVRPGAGSPAIGLLLRPRGADLRIDALPVPLSGASGVLRWSGAERALEIVDFGLRCRDAEIRVRGRVVDPGPRFTGEVRFWGRGLVLDRELHDALPPAVRRIWDAYGLAGAVDVTGADPGAEPSFDSFVRREAPGGPLALGVALRPRDASMAFHGYEDDDEPGVRHGFAWPVTGITGRIQVAWLEGGETTVDLREVRGRHGAVEVSAHGEVRDFGGGRAGVAIAVEARDLPLDDDVRNASPGMADLFRRYSPAGRASLVQVRVDQVLDLDRSAQESVHIEFDGNASFRVDRLPILLEGVSGQVDYGKERTPAGRVPTVSLLGMKARAEGGGELSMGGTVEGEGDPRLNISIVGEGIPLDGPLEAALRAADLRAAVSVWDRVRPSGLADVRATLTGPESGAREEYLVTLRGVSARGWGEVLYPVTGLRGAVEVRPGEVVLRGLRGEGAEGPVSLDGTVRDPGGEAFLDLALTATDALLDESLRDPLGPAADRARGYFDIVRPAPGLRGDVEVRLRGAGDALEPVIDARNIRGGIRPLDVRNLDVAEARARYEGGRVVVSDVLGAMGDREFTVREARFDLDAGTGSMDMEVRRLRFPRDLLGVLSEEAVAGIERVTPDRFFHVDRLDVTLSDGFRGIALDGVVSLSPTRAGRSDGLGVQGVFDLEGLAFRRGAEGDPATVITGAVLVRGGEFRPGVAVDSLDARIDFGGTFGPEGNRAVLTVSEAKGRVEERVLEGGSAIVEVNADGILLRELRGRVAKGEIGGWMQFPPGGGYEGRFSLSGAHAPDLFAPADPKAGVEGRISANARLRNRTGKPDDLGGNLRVDITEGALFRVPLFDSIYGILGLTEPPVFTGGTFDADLNGDRMRISRVDLESSVLGLHKSAGGSFLWLDGRIDLRLTPEFRGILETWPLRWIKDLISLPIKPVVERIHAIHVTGTLQRPVVNQDWLTFLSSRPEDRPRLPAPPREVDVPRRPPIDF